MVLNVLTGNKTKLGNGLKMHEVFNRSLLKRNFDKYANEICQTNFFSNYCGELLLEKLQNTSLKFERVLNLGARSEVFYDLLKKRNPEVQIIETNISEKFLALSKHDNKLIMDEEEFDFPDDQFDLVISCCTLHQVNDLVGLFIKIKKSLKDKGLFLANFLGEGSFNNLRAACLEADAKMGSASPKVAPFIEVKTLGSLLQRAGFYMPITDLDNLLVEYSKFLDFLNDLKFMGEGNILVKKSKGLMSPARLKLIEEFYLNKYKNPAKLDANFVIVNLTAFKN